MHDVPCLKYEKINRRRKAECRYGEHWGITAIPTCSWRGESNLQQGRLEAVRYSPRAAPTCLARPARLCGTSLATTSCYVCSRHAQAPHGSRTNGGYVSVCQYVALSYFAISSLVAKPRYPSQGDFRRFDPKVSIMFLLGIFLFAGLFCTAPKKHRLVHCNSQY